ncbi:MAG: hypothetical protein AAFQ98_25845 [Bacteroidota bacterium]
MFRILIAVLCIMPHCLGAQPTNDSIRHRILLELNGPVSSSTTLDATVEWECVDESLTGQCIEYHNDQWFSFIPQSDNTLYLNLLNQQCRDIRGIQVVLFTGVPCEPETYMPWICYSTGTQEDIYLTLDSLQPGVEYLVNIDGYLKDGCTFDLSLSTTPLGMPAFPEKANTTQPGEVVDSLMLLRWTLPDQYAAEIERFSIRKRSVFQTKAVVDREVPVEVNSVGDVHRKYGYVATIPAQQGPWIYEVWAMPSQEEPILLGTYKSKRVYASPSYWEGILYYPDEEEVTLRFLGPNPNAVLQKQSLRLDEGYAKFSLPLNSYRNQGLPYVQLEVYNSEGQKLSEYFYPFW